MQVNSNATFIGILECKHMAEEHDEEMAENNMEGNVIPNEMKIPHLHVITSFKNTFFDSLGLFTRKEIAEMKEKEEKSENSLEKHQEWIQEAREKLLAVLKILLCGDELAAEYTLLALLSGVHSRQNGLAIGQLCINLNNKSQDQKFAFSAAALLALTQAISPLTLPLPMTIKSLEEEYNFIPKKDYTTNELSQGTLQLQKGTQILVDETQI